MELLIAAGCREFLAHAWPDRRHITEDDVRAMGEVRSRHPEARLRIGGVLSASTLSMLETTGIDEIVVTPFNPQHLTTQSGWDKESDWGSLRLLAGGNPKVCVFAEPDEAVLRMLVQLGISKVEINCRSVGDEQRRADLASLCARVSPEIRIGLAHDLGAEEVHAFAQMEGVDWITVGHRFISDALLRGLQPAFRGYLGAVGETSLQSDRGR